MSDVDILGLEIENIEAVSILTIIGWVSMYFLFKYWMSIMKMNLWMMAIIMFIVCPVVSYFIAKRVEEKGKII